ncbi:MAG: SET domain-containing protein-lysine N-methyltransferase [candidate division Zixibacteria bacterium]|jgi:SET domain-containing protein|nr:SET domain-containing protein-lysine N-methyltransferase [candidate division Zixibacteria bacterium]
MARTPKTTSRPFVVRRSGIQGKGAFATRRIRKGQRIIEYTGKRLTTAEVDALYDDTAMERHHTFLFSVDENTTIDAAQGGNEARFINHSCDPNCEAVDEDGRIYIEAIKNIQPGVELTYDYNFELDEPYTRELRDFYVCRCMTRSCRGTILNVTPNQQKRLEAARNKRNSRNNGSRPGGKDTKRRRSGG